jgi:hypothetical protein
MGSAGDGMGGSMGGGGGAGPDGEKAGGRGGRGGGSIGSRDDGGGGGGKRRCGCFGRKGDGDISDRGDANYAKSPKVAWYILLAGMITVCVALGITGFVQGGSWVSPIGVSRSGGVFFCSFLWASGKMLTTPGARTTQFQVLFWSTVLLGALTAVWVVIKVKGADANKGLATASLILGAFVFVESMYPGIVSGTLCFPPSPPPPYPLQCF